MRNMENLNFLSSSPRHPLSPCSSLWALLNFDLSLSAGMAHAISSPWAEVLHAALKSARDGILFIILPPGSVEQFNFCQAFADHGGKEKGKENTTDQHVVVVIFKDVKLFRGIDTCLVDVQTICHHQTGRL